MNGNTNEKKAVSNYNMFLAYLDNIAPFIANGGNSIEGLLAYIGEEKIRQDVIDEVISMDEICEIVFYWMCETNNWGIFNNALELFECGQRFGMAGYVYLNNEEEEYTTKIPIWLNDTEYGLVRSYCSKGDILFMLMQVICWYVWD